MEINFEREVEVTESHFSLDAFTLLTRVGGIMGVGRTMVWMINLGLDNIIFIYSRFRKSGCNIFTCSKRKTDSNIEYYDLDKSSFC